MCAEDSAGRQGPFIVEPSSVLLARPGPRRYRFRRQRPPRPDPNDAGMWDYSRFDNIGASEDEGDDGRDSVHEGLSSGEDGEETYACLREYLRESWQEADD